MWSQLYFVSVSIIVFASVEDSSQRSWPSSTHYTAAVVEFSPDTSGNDTEVFEKNVNRYIELIGQAAGDSRNADIIVFPECGLVTFEKQLFSEVPPPAAEIAPCDDVHEGRYGNLRSISCAAKEQKIYVVINLYEIFPCTNETTSDYNETCPVKGAFYYNTNIVFDRKGAVIARYRKFNLFGEDGIGTPPEADLVTFDTDFGVTFGLFTCFDIMFEKPAVQLVRERNITDIIFPTAWFSEMPFLTAVQAQAAWSHGMNVNFLGAGYNNPALGSGGSGIYAGQGGIQEAVLPSEPSTHLLMSSLAKRPGTTPAQRKARDVTPPSGLFVKQDSLLQYTTHALDMANTKTVKMDLCNRGLCCNFEVSGRRVEGVEDGVSYTYRLVVFNGVRSFDGKANGGLQICAMLACTNESLSSCGGSFPNGTEVTPTEFQLIRIRGEFKKAGTQLPNTVAQDYMPLSADEYVMMWLPLDAGDLVTAEMILIKKASPITFGIFGRDFTRDSEKETSLASRLSTTTVGFITLLLVIVQTLCL